MKPKHILIVDDEPYVARVLARSLERAGYRVETAPNGQVALQKISEWEFDAVIADIQMPRMDGRELCERIQQALPGRRFPIIVMTSRVERELREWAASLPRVTFMEKPLSPRKLLRTLEQWVTSSTHETEGAHGR